MTFDPFGDFDTRGYLRNTKGLKDPEAVRLFEHTAFRLNVGKALAALRETTRPLGYQDVLDTHKRLFGRVYPWAGQDREAVAPLLAVGKGGRYDLFAQPRDARRAVEHALRMASDPVQMRAKPGEILGLLCHGHPLLDGNGRTLMTAHAELCRRAGFRIAWEDVAKADYLAALTRELERPGRVHLGARRRGRRKKRIARKVEHVALAGGRLPQDHGVAGELGAGDVHDSAGHEQGVAGFGRAGGRPGGRRARAVLSAAEVCFRFHARTIKPGRPGPQIRPDS